MKTLYNDEMMPMGDMEYDNLHEHVNRHTSGRVASGKRVR